MERVDLTGEREIGKKHGIPGGGKRQNQRGRADVAGPCYNLIKGGENFLKIEIGTWTGIEKGEKKRRGGDRLGKGSTRPHQPFCSRWAKVWANSSRQKAEGDPAAAQNVELEGAKRKKTLVKISKT